MEEKSEKYTKKKVSFMGGNLDPITSLFYKKKKSSAQKPIFLGEYENKNNNVIISGLIEGDDWRSDWTDKDYSEDLKKLDDPTPEHQGQQRNKETVRNHELKLETNNSEDIYGYNTIFDNELSRTFPYGDVEACY